MTAQFSDMVRFLGNSYAICAVKGIGLFEPEQFGFTPCSLSSACWRGFYCHYEVRENLFLLTQLSIAYAGATRLYVKYGKGKPLNGVIPTWKEREWCAFYDNLDLSIGFSGKMLIGRDFIRELYVHMGFHPAHTYREVYELVLEAGTVVNLTDCSERMAQIREAKLNRLDQPLSEDRAEVMRWIHERFSLQDEDYDD